MGGRVREILVARSGGLAMEQRKCVVVDTRGIVGDRYSIGAGFWSSFSDQSGSAITMISDEVLNEIGVQSIHARRNIVVDGLALGDLVGRCFKMGELLCFGVRPCEPCKYLEESVRVGLRRELRGIRGGLRVDVVVEGSLKVGDEISVVH